MNLLDLFPTAKALENGKIKEYAKTGNTPPLFIVFTLLDDQFLRLFAFTNGRSQ